MTQRKANAVTIGLVLLALGTAYGAGPAAFGISTKKVGTYTSKRNVDCSNHQTKMQSVAIQITVKNLAQTNAAIKVEWYFVARRADTGAYVLFGEGLQTVDLKRSGTTNLVVKSDTLYLHDPACVEMNPQTDAKMAGYVVRATGSDGTVRFEATQPSLKDIVESSVAFDKLKQDSKTWRGSRPKSRL
jgi:hypothetical protein